MAQGCPPDDVVAAHVIGALGPDDAEALGQHLDGCDTCRSAVIELVRAAATTGAVRARRDPRTLEPGATVGRYRLERLLGAGGMGVVYAAHDPALDRLVALKVLRPDLIGDAGALAARLVRESRLMARVTDPAVIVVHDVGHDGDRVFLAMELIDGATLGAWLDGRRSVDEILAVFRRAGAGLAAAHQAGVVHRDFKPENVLVAPAGADAPTRVVVTDFGVARAAAAVELVPGASRAFGDDAGDLTATGVAIGTPAYMAPEQLDGAVADARADVFAFGVTLWEALHGARPFTGRTPAELRAAIERGPAAAVATASGRITPALRGLLRAMLAVDPTHRPQHMDDVLTCLAPRTRRPRWVMAAAAIAVTTVAAAATVAMARSTPAPSDRACTAPRARLARTWSPPIAASLRTMLARAGAAPDVLDPALTRLGERAEALGHALDATCRGEPAPQVSACLAARQVELDAVVAEAAAMTPATVASLTSFTRSVQDPSACLLPGVSMLEPRWPRPPALRHAVAELRHRFAAIEAQRDRAEFPAALAAAEAMTAEVAAAGWEPLLAEHLYLVGTIQSFGTDPAAGIETLRRAAAIAERVHHDYMAANLWIQLTQSATLDERAPERGLEYAAYAGAASARLGRPPVIEAHLAYARGTALIEHGDLAAGEAELRAGLALAERDVPELVGMSIQGLAYAYENQGRYRDAVETYRRALTRLEADGELGSASEVVYRGRLATNLAQIGEVTAAVAEGRIGAALADRILDARHADRAIAHINLAGALRVGGDFRAALDELTLAKQMLAATSGERSETYGDVLTIESGLVADLGEPVRAVELAERGCEILAFGEGDDSLRAATCWVEAAWVLIAAGRHVDAIERVKAGLPILEQHLGTDHAHVANAYNVLGEATLALGDRTAAAAAFENARQRMKRSTIDPAYLASAEWGLAQAIERRDPARALALVEQAAARWRAAPASWSEQLAQAEAWLSAPSRGRGRLRASPR